jgi:hypothetical protein
MVGVTKLFTVITNEFEVTTIGVAQFALLVSWHTTMSLLASELFEYVFVFVPTLTPFNLH